MTLPTVGGIVGSTPKLHGKSISEQRKGLKNFETKPEILTLMAIGLELTETGVPKSPLQFWVRTYRIGIDPNADERAIGILEADLFDMAVKGKAINGAVEVSRNVNGIDFDKNSYFTIVANIKGWDFVYDSKFPGYDQFRFYGERDEMVDQKISTVRMHENYSFFDAVPGLVKGFNAVRSTNYRKREKSEDDLAKGENSPLGFNIFLHAPLTGLVEEPRVIVIIDPTGENKGPT